VGVPAGFSIPGNFRQITATVAAPGINLVNVNVGRDLQQSISVTLDAAPPAPVSVTLQTGAASTATIASTGTVEGTGTVTFNNVTTATVGTVFIQGRALGTTSLTAQAVGYQLSTSTITVDPSGFIINSPGVINTTANAANSSVQITPARLNPTTLNFSANQAVRGGLSVNVPVSTTNPAVGVMTPTTAAFTGGQSSVNVAFDPLAVGTTQITVGLPSGFSLPGQFVSINATVNP
jgi:hypothetical protein